jgi:hypothetical protein
VKPEDIENRTISNAQQALQGKQVPAFTGSAVQWNWQNTVYGFKEKHKLLPIPLKELELNPNMSQPPGW